MKALAILVLSVLSAPALGAPTPRTVYAELGLSQAAPTTNPNPTLTPKGTSTAVPGALKLTGCTSYRVTLCALTGVISATGTMQVYYWSDFFPSTFTPTKWPRNRGIDETVPTTVATDCAGTTCQCVTFPDHPIYGFGGWIYVAPASVTTTGAGTTVGVLVEASCGF